MLTGAERWTPEGRGGQAVRDPRACQGVGCAVVLWMRRGDDWAEGSYGPRRRSRPAVTGHPFALPPSFTPRQTSAPRSTGKAGAAARITLGQRSSGQCSSGQCSSREAAPMGAGRSRKRREWRPMALSLRPKRQPSEVLGYPCVLAQATPLRVCSQSRVLTIVELERQP